MMFDVRVGDSRSIELGCSPDVMITDPVWPNCPPGAIAGSDDPRGLFEGVVANMPDSIRRAVVVMRSDSDPTMLAPLAARLPFRMVAWLRYAMPGYLGRALGGNEIAYCFGEYVPSAPGRRVVPAMAPVAQPGGRAGNPHPMPRALVHMRWLVNWWSEPDELIYDPYSGSGTTGVAAALEGRRFVGVDIDPQWEDVARRRIADALRQGDLLRGAHA